MPKINHTDLDLWTEAGLTRTGSKGQQRGTKRPSEQQQAAIAYRRAKEKNQA
jgi:hypothetical protein